MNSQLASPEPSSKSKSSSTQWRESASLPQLAKKVDASLIQDIYQSVLWRIDSKRRGNETLAVGLTGCQARSGSTTIAANLAVQASMQQRGRVLLIDAHWQVPGLLKTFQASQQPGWYDILSGELSPRECELQSIGDGLDLLCRGKWSEDQPTNVRQELVAECLADFREQYSLIIVDLPIAEEQRCALPVTRQLDGTLLVARFETVKQPQAQRALRRLQHDGVTVWGTLLNRHREYVPKWLQSWL